MNFTGLNEVFCTAKNLQVLECGPISLVNTLMASCHSITGLSPLKQRKWTKFTPTEYSQGEYLRNEDYLLSTAEKKSFVSKEFI